MKASLVCGLAALACLAGDPVFKQSEFRTGSVQDWKMWTPRDETAPRLGVDEVQFRTAPGSLMVSGASNIAVLGGWERVVRGIEPGRWYRFEAYYKSDRLDYEPRQVVPRLDWLTSSGKRAGKPEYVYAAEPGEIWTQVAMDAPAPKDATAVRLQLLLWDAPNGTVWWDDISLTAIPEPRSRPVRIASINLQPRQTGSAEASVTRFIETVDKTVTSDVDVILLPEGITVVGTGKKYADVAEPVPGPTTSRLGELARRHNAYVAAGIYEREGPAIYNIAVLLDRSGKLVGKYRKVYIPREETEGGIKPGSHYPVFETDFGKVGIMICWDVQYADPARALALDGAEIILMPIWGGNETLAKARAIENHVYLATSGYGYPTHILDPNGETLAIAEEEGTAAITTVHLNKRYVDDWLGYMRGRFFKELRLDIDVP